MENRGEGGEEEETLRERVCVCKWSKKRKELKERKREKAENAGKGIRFRRFHGIGQSLLILSGIKVIYRQSVN